MKTESKTPPPRQTCDEILEEIRNKGARDNSSYQRQINEAVNQAEGRGWND